MSARYHVAEKRARARVRPGETDEAPDVIQLDKPVLLSWIGSGDVITLKTQLIKTVLLS